MLFVVYIELCCVLQYHVHPPSATRLVQSLAPLLFTYVTDTETGIVTGYGMTVTSQQVTIVYISC